MRGDTEAKEHLVVLGMLAEAFLHGPEALNAVGALFLLFAVQKAFVPALPPGEEARDEEKESQQARPRALKESIPRPNGSSHPRRLTGQVRTDSSARRSARRGTPRAAPNRGFCWGMGHSRDDEAGAAGTLLHVGDAWAFQRVALIDGCGGQALLQRRGLLHWLLSSA